jgi:hypothetical protein
LEDASSPTHTEGDRASAHLAAGPDLAWRLVGVVSDMVRERITRQDIAQHDFGKQNSSSMRAVLQTHMKIKNYMIHKYKYRIRVKCTHEGCEGYIHAHRARSNNHTSIWCDGTCGMRMIE